MFSIENLENADKAKQALVILSPKEITTVDILIFSSLHTYSHTHVHAHTHRQHFK